MLKISFVEGCNRRRLIVEGKLTAPWAAELLTACESAKTELAGRELIIDLKRVTATCPEANNVLLRLMTDSVKFECGVFMHEVLRQLCKSRGVAEHRRDDEPTSN